MVKVAPARLLLGVISDAARRKLNVPVSNVMRPLTGNRIKFRDTVSELFPRCLVLVAKQHALRDECRAANTKRFDPTYQSQLWALPHNFAQGNKS